MDPFKDLPVGLHHATEILSEAVLIQDPIVGIAAALIPEAAAFQVENSRAAAQRAEIIRHLEGRARDAAEDRRAA